jgi:hypothetical protein
MPRRFMATAAMLLAVVILLPGTSSLAHNVAVGTRTSRSKLPRGPINPGQRAIVFGRVAAQDSVCKDFVVVELLRRVPGPDRTLGSTTTDGDGDYFFLRRPRGDQELYARFAGFHDVVAGHDHNCGGSVSRTILLGVRR